MKKRAILCKQVKQYLNKVLNMDTLQSLGIIGAFIMLHLIAIIILGAILIAIDYDNTPAKFKPTFMYELPSKTLELNNIKRANNGLLVFNYTDKATGEKYVKVGMQWKNKRTGRIVSAKSLGM